MKTRPEEAGPALTAILGNPEEDVDRQCDAAFALAAASRSEGLEWLKAGCSGNLGLGARPAVHLLESGPRGEELYWSMLRGKEGRTPSYAFKHSIAECREDLFLKHLLDYLRLGHQELRIQTWIRMRSVALSGDTLDRVLEFVEGNPPDGDDLRTALIESFLYSPSPEPASRAAASLWMDRLAGRGSDRLWLVASRAFLEARLGTRDLMARWARRLLSKPLLDPIPAYQVLAEAGLPDDALAISRSLEGLADRSFQAHVHAWFAIVRLTAGPPRGG